MSQRIRYIIKPPGAYTAFREFARQHGLRIIDKVEREPRNPIALQEVFGNAERTVGVHYIEDGLAEMPYIQVAGPQAEHFARLIEANLPVYSPDEVLAAWDSASSIEDKIDALLRVGLAANATPSPTYVERIRAGLLDAAPEVRSAALTAYSYHPWNELRDVVERIGRQDADEDARERARVIVDAWNTTSTVVTGTGEG
jgi:hypothetical protein